MSETQGQQSQTDAQVATKAQDTEGHVVQTGGSSPVSFDQFESIKANEEMQARKEKRQARADKKAEAPKDEPKAKDKKAEPKKETKGETKEIVKDASTSTAPEGEAKAPATEADPKEGATAQGVAEKVRTLRVKSGDKEVELRSDTAFQVKVDGQKQDVSLQELMSNWSGNKAVDKRLTEFSQEKQKYVVKERQLNDTIDSISQDFESEKFDSAIMKMARSFGADPIDVIEKIEQRFLEKAMSLSQMTDDERRVHLAEHKEKRYRDVYEQGKNTQKMERSRLDLDRQIEEMGSKHGVSGEEFDRAAEWLFEQKEKGSISQEVNLTPETIVSFIVREKAIEQSQSLLSKVDEKLATNQEAVEKVLKLKEAGLPDEDIEDIVSKMFTKATPHSQELSNKIRKSTAEERVTTTVSPQNSNIFWSFDQV